VGVETDNLLVPASSPSGRRCRSMAARCLLALVPVALAMAALTPGAQGASQLVTGQVAPIMGERTLADGTVVGGSTVDSAVIRERRGDQLIITVVPRG